MLEANGQILDAADNQAMPGVVVYNTNTKKSTTTDVNGYFSLIDSDGAPLSFRMFSYETLNVTGSQATNTYKMKAHDTTLDTVVATGCYKKSYVRENGACVFSWMKFFDNNKWWFISAIVLIILLVLIIAKWPLIKEKLS